MESWRAREGGRSLGFDLGKRRALFFLPLGRLERADANGGKKTDALRVKCPQSLAAYILPKTTKKQERIV